MSLRRLSDLTHIDHSHLGRFERAERAPVLHQVQLLDPALGAEGALVQLWLRTVALPLEEEDEGQAVEEGVRAWLEKVNDVAATPTGRGDVIVRLNGRSATERALAAEFVGRVAQMAREPRYSAVVVGFEYRER